MVRGHGPADPFATVGGMGGSQRNVPTFIRSSGGNGVSGRSAASEFSGMTMNTAMLVSSSSNRHDSYAGSSSGQPQNTNM